MLWTPIPPKVFIILSILVPELAHYNPLEMAVFVSHLRRLFKIVISFSGKKRIDKKIIYVVQNHNADASISLTVERLK